MRIRRNIVLQLMKCFPPSVMNISFTLFRLLTHLGVNSIWATGVFIKNRLRKCTSVGDKQPQKRECGHFEQSTSSKKSSATLTVVGLNDIRAVYIASSKFSEPKRFVRRLNKVERKYTQEQLQINSTFTTRTWVFSTGWTRTFSSTRLVSEWKSGGGCRLLKWSMLFFRMRRSCIILTKMKAMRLCLS